MRILGIDPGLRHTGWGMIESHQGRLRYIASGRINPNASLAMTERLQVLHQELSLILQQYTPDSAAIEETFVNDNALTSLKLGHARGALMLTLGMHGLSVAEYAPRLVKKSVVGVGNAAKEQVQMMIKHLLPTAPKASADEADALAVAICHLAFARVPKSK
jgi:crossover junction endodeoxyribonuclease RuvC